jgi:peptidoglycan/LPS O-acetylase OafA/YrhL
MAGSYGSAGARAMCTRDRSVTQMCRARRRLWVPGWQHGGAAERLVPAVDSATPPQQTPSPQSTSRSIRYSPALDGLRALAVLSVMLFHLDAFALGWAGVPLFFVLSGYLITSILLSQRGQPLGAYLSSFYWRRTMRIFPLYYAYLGVNAVAWLAKGLSLVGYGWFLTYLANYLIGIDHGQPGDGWVDHLWSLAVEEQFYLIWPAVVFFLAGSLRGIALVLILAAPVARELTWSVTGNAYLTIVTLPACMDMLFAGALVAVSRHDRRLLWSMAVVGAALIAYSLEVVPYADFAVTTRWVPRGQLIYTGFALLFGPLMLACEYLGPVTRLLRSGPLVYTGKISYGLYLWHPIAFTMGRKIAQHAGIAGIPAMGVCIALAFLGASISWYGFERYFLRWKDALKTRRARAGQKLAVAPGAP